MALQGSVNWNQAVLDYTGVTANNPNFPLNAGNFSAGQASNGKLAFAWTDMIFMGQTAVNGSTLFALHFNVLNSSIPNTLVSFSNTPLALQIDTVDANYNVGIINNAVFAAGTITLGIACTPTSSTINHAICTNTTYLFNGQNLNTAGTYLDTLVNAAGCDSIITLNLTVKSPSSSSTNTSICSSALPYSWNNITLNASGSQTVHFTNAVGCDSAATLNLTVNNATSNTSNVTACDSYTWTLNNQTYTSSGTYQVVTGCHTEILNLTIHTTPTVTATANNTICAGNSVTLSGSGATTYSWNNGITNGVAFTPTTTTTYTVTGTTNGCSNTAQTTITVNSLAINAGPDVSVCLGGSITLNAIAATPISWTGGIINNQPFVPTAPGMYIATTNSNGCSGSDTVNVFINALPTVNAGIDQTLCPGYYTTLNGYGFILGCNGSTIPVSWNNGIQNGVPFLPTSTTSYVVTGIANNGCSNTDTITIFVKTFNIISSNTVLCNGTSVTLTAAASTTPYIWKKNGVTMPAKITQSILVSAAGDYLVQMTDSMCGLRVSDTFHMVAQANPATPTISPSGTVTVCVGTMVNMTATAGYPLYNWYLDASNIAMPGITSNAYAASIGSFRVRVMDSLNCWSSYSTAKTIKNTATPVPAFTITTLNTLSKKLTSSNTGTYQWRLNGNNIANATAKNYTATISGNYSLTVTNNSGCTATSPDTFINISAPKLSKVNNTSNNSLNNNYTVYPNPSSGNFIVESPETVNAIVRDVQGKTILEVPNATQIDLSNSLKGIYILQLYNNQGELVKTMKLMKY